MWADRQTDIQHFKNKLKQWSLDLPSTVRSKCFSEIPAMFSARQEYREAWEFPALEMCSRQPSSRTTIPSSVWLSRTCWSLNHVTSGGGTPAAGQNSVMVSLTITSGFEMTSDVSIDAGTETHTHTINSHCQYFNFSRLQYACGSSVINNRSTTVPCLLHLATTSAKFHCLQFRTKFQKIVWIF